MSPRARLARVCLAAAALVALWAGATPVAVGILAGAVVIDVALAAREAWDAIRWFP